MVEDLKSRAGLASKRVQTQQQTMTGPSSHSWPCRTAPMRKLESTALKRNLGRDSSKNRSTEDFSYFTLRRQKTDSSPPTSIFGISCTRQIDANQLHNRPSDVTRSTVQKAVVAIADSPQFFGQLREKLLMVTGAWFAQKYG